MRGTGRVTGPASCSRSRTSGRSSAAWPSPNSSQIKSFASHPEPSPLHPHNKIGAKQLTEIDGEAKTLYTALFVHAPRVFGARKTHKVILREIAPVRQNTPARSGAGGVCVRGHALEHANSQRRSRPAGSDRSFKPSGRDQRVGAHPRYPLAQRPGFRKEPGLLFCPANFDSLHFGCVRVTGIAEVD